MILYHYTAHSMLAAIRQEGITKGEMPLSPTHVRHGVVWLTTDPDSSGHGLSDGGVVPIEEVRALKRAGLLAPHMPEDGSITWADKRAVRIAVKIHSSDPQLKRWITWGRKQVDRDWFQTLTDAGGGNRKARTWYVSLRPILPSELISIDILRPDLSTSG